MVLLPLGFNNQLFLDVTGRGDFNGAYAEQKINYFYPSASLSWIASETFHLPEFFNLLKARLGSGRCGEWIIKTRSVDTYSFETSDWGPAKTVVLNAALVDPNIKPQHSITKELGVDALAA